LALTYLTRNVGAARIAIDRCTRSDIHVAATCILGNFQSTCYGPTRSHDDRLVDGAALRVARLRVFQHSKNCANYACQSRNRRQRILCPSGEHRLYHRVVS
jgi:hypothetical protein